MWFFFVEIREYEKPPQSIDLMITNVSVVPWEICNGPHAYKGLVGKHAFCAGSMEGGADSCQVILNF